MLQELQTEGGTVIAVCDMQLLVAEVQEDNGPAMVGLDGLTGDYCTSSLHTDKRTSRRVLLLDLVCASLHADRWLHSPSKAAFSFQHSNGERRGQLDIYANS